MNIKDYKKDIPYIQQTPRSLECGAVCLEMLLDSYGDHHERQEIWNAVSEGSSINSKDCRTYKMVQYMNHLGYSSIAISCPQITDVLELCRANEIDVIVRYRRSNSVTGGHYSVVVGHNYKGILLNDPWPEQRSGAGKAIKETDLRSLMQFTGTGDMALPFVFILVAKPDVATVKCVGYHNLSTSCSFQAFECILSLDPRIICSIHDSAFMSYDIVKTYESEETAEFDLSEQPVAAGRGVYLGPDSFIKAKVLKSHLDRRGVFGVRVEGDSMLPRYKDGDILVVADDVPDLGGAGIYIMNNMGYVKIRRENHLESLNSEYEPIPMDEDSIKCRGKVIQVLDKNSILSFEENFLE